MSIEAMKLALEALEKISKTRYHIETPPVESLEEQMRRIADRAITAIKQARSAPVQEPVALEWDEVYDAAAAAYCRSEASRKALRLCFQTRDQTTQISIGWTANELMAFAKTIAYVCTTPPAAPVQEPVGCEGAIVNGRVYADRLEHDYQFECQAGPLRLCNDWVEFRRCFEWLAEHATPPAQEFVCSTGLCHYRKPLTDEQREQIANAWRGRNWTVGDIIDAIEAAHGITGETK